MEIYETLENNYIEFDNIQVHVLFDKHENVWFNAKQIIKALGYKDYRDAIRKHVNKKYTLQKKQLTDDSIGQPTSLYLNEASLYRLIFKSRLPKAIKFADWVYEDLLPTIRKFGTYKLKKNTENDIQILLKQINFLEKQNNLLKNDLKKETFPQATLVYVIDYSTDFEEIYRIGRTTNMASRKKIYNTHTLNKMNVVHYVETDCANRFEICLKSMLYDYRYRNNKDFYMCSLKFIKDSFKRCNNDMKCVDDSKKSQNGGSISNFISDQIQQLNARYDKLNKRIVRLDKLLIF